MRKTKPIQVATKHTVPLANGAPKEKPAPPKKLKLEWLDYEQFQLIVFECTDPYPNVRYE